jgi:cytochrome c556
MRVLVLPFLAVVVLAQAPSGFKPSPVGNLKQVMRSIPLPNSNLIFAVQRQAPKNEEEWKAVEDSARAISETANLIIMPGRLRENGQPVPVRRPDFIKYAQGLVQAGQDCYKAAVSRSQEAVSDCTANLADSCSNCHDVYRDAPQPDPGAQKKR